ncbi:MAG TPA: SBBP repeat-containing protein [Bryobacteraceae bacterium]|nr:SBBP repeat-containing protein [Bryobacteraceae bacterium]
MSVLVSFIGAASMLMAAAPPSGPEPSVVQAQAKAALAKLPLRFEANQGQLNPSVRYSAHAGGYNLFLGEQGASLSISAGSAKNGKQHRVERVDISLVNGNRAPQIEGLDRLQSRTDFFVGNRANWHTNVPSFSRVRYRAVYPGVDVTYYGNQSQLEYDFVLQPGADPNAIRMKFSGHAHLSVSPEGDLVLDAGGARMVQHKPFIYQEDPQTSARRQVQGRYKLLGHNTVGLQLANYDRTRTLVVDPTLTYLSYLGGTGFDQVNAVKLGPNGLLYLAMQTDTAVLPAAGYQSDNTGLTDAWIGVLDPSAQGNFGFLYGTYLGGTNTDIPLGIDVDASGVIYVTGSTASTDYPVTSNAFQPTGAGATLDAFVAKIDPSQSGSAALIFSSYLGGLTGDDVGNGVAVDKNGVMYVVGTTKSSDFPVTPSAYAGVQFGSQDAFITQIDPNAGSVLYSTYIGGEDLDYGKAILVGPTGLVYFAASTLSTQFPMAGYSYSGSSFGFEDVVVGVLDVTQSGTNSLVYATYLGGSSNDEVNAMAFDAKGNIIVTGYTLSTDFPVTTDAMQPVYGGNADTFVSVLNPNLSFGSGLVYSTFLGGSHSDVAYGVGADSAGNIYVTGYTLSPDFPVLNAVQPSWASGIEIYLTKLKPGVPGPAGLQYSTYLGLSSIYVPTAMAVGPDGTAYVVGYAQVGLTSTYNALQPGGYAGATDGFLFAVGK